MRKSLKDAALALLLLLIAGGVTLYIMSRPDMARFSTAELSGRVPVMASQRTETFPTVNVPEATSWHAGQAQRAAQDRKSAVEGKRVAVRVELVGGRVVIKKKKCTQYESEQEKT